jgi:hypothetical protein
MAVTRYNPELWLETLTRGIQEYAQEGFNDSVVDPGNNAVGSEIYEVIMEFPATDEILRKVPLQKTLIHFEMDIIEDLNLGFSGREETIVKSVYNAATAEITQQEGVEHRVNFDVGIWTSDRAGGKTQRLRAYQNLIRLFQGKLAYDDLRDATKRTDAGQFDGCLEIYNFSGGRFFTDSVNDVLLYRLIDCSLVIRCYSRTSPFRPPLPTIEEIFQDPELIIDDNLTLPD